MMTLEEAIEHCEKVAKESREAALSYARANAYETAISCKAVGYEHEQIAKWLTELKTLKQIQKSMNEAAELCKKNAWHIRMPDVLSINRRFAKMIKLENTEVSGLKAAIRGMRNPMNSWEQSDSHYAEYPDDDVYCVGEKDLDLMKRLVSAGTDHSKFMRMITVTADITAPLYWWKEYDTYKVGTVANSCSTMHKIAAKRFELDDFSHDKMHDSTLNILEIVVNNLNYARDMYNAADAERKKSYWWQMIQLLPSSYNQRRTVLLNYAVLRNIYHARRNHKLDEWHQFCEWIEGLPYSELITMKGGE